METKTKINLLAKFVARNAFGSIIPQSSFDNSESEKIEMMIREIKDRKFGLASDIAESVLKFKKCSEKQAYHISKYAIENGLDVQIMNMDEEIYGWMEENELD